MALFAAGFTTFALIYCVQPIMPVLGRAFHIDAETAARSLSATTQCLAVATLVARVGDLAGRIGRGGVFPVLVAPIALGLWTTLAGGISAILFGPALATFAFYGAHTVASIWVGIAAREAKAQASSPLYLFAS